MAWLMFKYPILSPSLDGQVFIVIGIVTKKEKYWNLNYVHRGVKSKIK